MVAVDVYVNETTRHADVILPPAWTFAEDYFEAFLPNVAVRNFARFAPPVVARGAGERADWEILLEIAERMGGGRAGSFWSTASSGWLAASACAGRRIPRSTCCCGLVGMATATCRGREGSI
jgi:anaerobic selenocysteine-containing dehydrogenase